MKWLEQAQYFVVGAQWYEAVRLRRLLVQWVGEWSNARKVNLCRLPMFTIHGHLLVSVGLRCAQGDVKRYFSGIAMHY